MTRSADSPWSLLPVVMAATASAAAVLLLATGDRWSYALVPLVALLSCVTLVTAMVTHARQRRILASLRERDQRQEMEQARALHALEKSLDAREGFLTMAMHDIRSPLTALRLYVQASLRRLQLTSESSTEIELALRKVESQVERMRQLVDDLLDVSRAASGHLEVRLEQVDLESVIRDVLSRHQAEARNSRCEVRLTCAGPVIGRWDTLRLEQLFANLLGNALKYGVGHPIEVTLEQQGDCARLEVRDHGPGLPLESRDRLFQRFERLSAEHRVGSTGLGLWIVQTIVQALGGSVSCASDGPGQGTAFVVLLPLAGPHVDGAQSRPEDPTEAPAARVLQG